MEGYYWKLTEIGGTGKGLLYEEKNPMQKHSERVDNIKNEWARKHGYILLRIWEDDINKNPSKVMDDLKKVFGISDKNNDKKKRH